MDKKRKLYSDTSQQPLWSLRKITINPTDKDDLRRFPSNAISTYRYTPMTFLVKNLWEQFHRVINWWFLLIAIIQAIPQLHYNPNHVWSTALPLSVGEHLLSSFQRHAVLSFVSWLYVLAREALHLCAFFQSGLCFASSRKAPFAASVSTLASVSIYLRTTTQRVCWSVFLTSVLSAVL